MTVGRILSHRGDSGYVLAEDGTQYRYRGLLATGVEPGSKCEFVVTYDYERGMHVGHSARLTVEAAEARRVLG